MQELPHQGGRTLSPSKLLRHQVSVPLQLKTMTGSLGGTKFSSDECTGRRVCPGEVHHHYCPADSAESTQSSSILSPVSQISTNVH